MLPLLESNNLPPILSKELFSPPPAPLIIRKGEQATQHEAETNAQAHPTIVVQGNHPVRQRHAQQPQRDNIEYQDLKHRPGATHHTIEDKVQADKRIEESQRTQIRLAKSHTAFLLQKQPHQRLRQDEQDASHHQHDTN